MKIAASRLTAQNQVSVPTKVRQRLGLAPGSVLEWDAEGGEIVVRRARRFSSQDLHRALFPEGPPAKRTLKELDQGIRRRVRDRHAGD
jgi:AbrB family looped-hinge helix DNA binding protein